MREGISDYQNKSNRNVYFKISFVVSKNGLADDLNILEGADDELNKAFIKVFNKAKKDWKPAMLSGKPVNVQMTMQL
jgi:TonB-like protein